MGMDFASCAAALGLSVHGAGLSDRADVGLAVSGQTIALAHAGRRGAHHGVRGLGLCQLRLQVMRIAAVKDRYELLYWRKRWDSNPRTGLPVAGFQDRCLQPLGHASVLQYPNFTNFVATTSIALVPPNHPRAIWSA